MATDIQSSPAKPDSQFRLPRGMRWLVGVSHSLVLVLSLVLIIYISYDTFENIPFLENHHYMTFQFWVCMVFLADFFIEFFLAPSKKSYLASRWFFLVISIPYLNIINLYNLTLSKELLFFVRFIPLIRGAYSLAMVMGYISNNRAVSLMSQYVSILLALVYLLSLVFYFEEYKINPDVSSFWDALYWAAMNTTTVGCYFSAVTPVGKVISVVLPTAGMLILPLFTVYVTDRVKALNQKQAMQQQLFEQHIEQKDEKTAAEKEEKKSDKPHPESNQTN